MKRIFIWILILQFATGHNLPAELLRLPYLHAHFQQHLQENPQLSFRKYLADHYGTVQHQHRNDAHKQLPGHSTHSSMAESTLPQPWRGFCLLSFQAPERRSVLPTGHPFPRSEAYVSGLFRPPIA